MGVHFGSLPSQATHDRGTDHRRDVLRTESNDGAKQREATTTNHEPAATEDVA
jgi:hypothetical protein